MYAPHARCIVSRQGPHRKTLGRGKSTVPPNLPGARGLRQRGGLAAFHQQPLHWLRGQDGVSLGCSFGPVHAGQGKKGGKAARRSTFKRRGGRRQLHVGIVYRYFAYLRMYGIRFVNRFLLYSVLIWVSA